MGVGRGSGFRFFEKNGAGQSAVKKFAVLLKKNRPLKNLPGHFERPGEQVTAPCPLPLTPLPLPALFFRKNGQGQRAGEREFFPKKKNLSGFTRAT